MKNSFEVYNPYDGTLVGLAPENSTSEVKKIIKQTHGYRMEKNGRERSFLLKDICKGLRKKKSELSKLITSESGLCVKQTKHEVSRTLEVLEAAAEVSEDMDANLSVKKYLSKNIPFASPSLEIIADPLELVAGITPFNHPLNLVAHKCCPAIAANSPMVLKPSEKTPLTAIRFLEILRDCGLDEQFVNVVTGSNPKKIVECMAKDENTKLLSFTGGHKVGMTINKMLSERRTPIQYVCELSGNSALTILDDADLEKSAEVAMGAFDNSGQRCTSIKRILLQNTIADEFIDIFTHKAENFKCGNPSDPNIDIGTLIDEEAAKNVETVVNSALNEGATLIYGNNRKGSQYSHTILDKVNPSSTLVTSETFGPVAPIMRIDNIRDAVKVINSSEYKLAGAVMTRDRNKAVNFANEIGVGQFNWNGPPGYRTEKAPFGGFGLSGNGLKEGVVDTVRNYQKVRTFYTHL